MLIDSSTHLFGVFGNPIHHSLSPIMHNSAFKAVNYNGVYLAFQVEDLKQAVAGIHGLNLIGVSVTIPHKITVMEYLDEIDPMAVKIGAVNTIHHVEGRLLGSNTDYLGAIRALKEKTEIKNKKVALIGAGGAARSIGFGICNEEAKLEIYNIIPEEGEKLASELNVNYTYLPEMKSIDCDILINATPVGMSPNVDEIPIPKKILEPHMTVMDIVYNPLKTKILKEAETLGCTIIDGVSMFVYQGVSQFELWTKTKAPVQVMRETVIQKLKQKQ